MSIISTIPNYGGRLSTSAYTKQFVTSVGSLVTWIYNATSNPQIKTITPSDKNADVLIQNDLFVLGTIQTSSYDEAKENCNNIDSYTFDNLMKLEPKKYNYFFNPAEEHFGFSTSDVESNLPNLVKEHQIKLGGPFVKSINYIEMIPLLLAKIQAMQKEIDDLKKNNM
jgi:hypothetical protein